MTLIGSPHLTGERRLAVPGMAYFAATGPAGTYCNGCIFLDRASQRRVGRVHCARCHKYTQLMYGQRGPAFPTSMESCKFFEPTPGAVWA